MPEVLNNFIDPHDGVDQGKYRNAVARLLRLLIRARLIQEPGFLEADDWKRWKIEQSQAEEKSLKRLLQEAVIAGDALFHLIMDTGNSMGVGLNDPRSELKIAVNHLVEGVYWDKQEIQIENDEDGESIMWDSLIPIETVRLIREGLDSLPEYSAAERVAPSPPQYLEAEHVDSDGPKPPDRFIWEGKTAKLAPKPWALVNFLWGQRRDKGSHKTIWKSDFDSAAREVWDDEGVADRRAIDTATSRANGAFKETGMPFRVSVRKPDSRHKYVMLICTDSNLL